MNPAENLETENSLTTSSMLLYILFLLWTQLNKNCDIFWLGFHDQPNPVITEKKLENISVRLLQFLLNELVVVRKS